MLALRIAAAAMLAAASLAAPLEAQNWYGQVFRKVHLDYHLNPWIQNAASAVTPQEARRQMKMMKEAGVEAVEIFAYDHFGQAFYPSEVAPRHPTLANDYFGNMRQAAREQGIRIIAYVNVFGSVPLFAKHPEWYVVDQEGKHPAASWLPQERSLICASSPFQKEVLQPLLREMISRYAPEAIWLDAGSWLVESHCYCQYCRQQYRAFSGADIPGRPVEQDGPEAWQKWTRWRVWRRSQIREYVSSIAKFIHDLQPGILVTDNNSGRYEMGVPVVEAGRLARWAGPRELGLDYLSCDPVPFAGNHAVILGRLGRYQSPLGIPFDYMNERFQGWGEWHLRETLDFQLECATIVANGGRCFLADQPWPDGTLEPEVYRRIKATYDFIKPREGPYRSARPVAEVAILAAETTNTLASDLRLLAPASARTDAVHGAYLTLVQEGFPFQIVSEANLEAALPSLRVLVVPEQVLLLDGSVKAIRAFVAQGGRLLISGQSGGLDYDGSARDAGAAESLMGVRVKGARRAPVNYLWFAESFRKRFDLPALPMMVRGPMLEFEAEGGEVLAEAVEPRDDPWDEKGHWRQYTVTGAMPPKSTPAGPAAVLRKVGQGRILYVAGHWFTTYQREGNPAVRKMLAGFLSTLLPEQERSLVIEKPLRVEASLMRNDAGYLVSLVNSAMQKQSTQFVHAEEVAPAENIEITLRLPEKVKRVRSIPEGQELQFRSVDGGIRFTAPRLEILAAMQVEVQP